MMLFRFIAFVAAAVALAGCCVSSTGCYVPVPGVPTAWDGAGTRPGDGAEPRRQSTTRIARSKTEIIIGPITDGQGEGKPPSDKGWAQRKRADTAQHSSCQTRL